MPGSERRVDIALTLEPPALSADIRVIDGDLVADNGLITAAIASLLTDRRATTDELARFETSDPRGYWGDSLADVPGDRWGSGLWLLGRAKQTQETLNLARGYAQEALAFFVEDGVAEDVRIDASYPLRGLLALHIAITRARGDVVRFDFVWDMAA